MTTIDTLRASYSARASDPTLSATDRAVAAEQLARLPNRLIVTTPSDGFAPSRWVHVPLETLFEEAGNVLTARRNGTYVCGHEPLHSSRSGTCVVIWFDEGWWWCSSCRTRGDALTFLMALRGGDAREATFELIRRFGPPAIPAGQLRRRRARARVIEV